MTDFNVAIRRNPKLAFAYARRGVLRQEQQDLTGALADLNEAVRLNAADLSYRLTRAKILADLDKHAEAVADYSAFLEASPNGAGVRAIRGNLYRKLRQFDKALDDLQKLRLPLLVQVASETAPLEIDGATVGSVSKGQRLQLLRTDGGWLWVETKATGDAVARGWIRENHVQ